MCALRCCMFFWDNLSDSFQGLDFTNCYKVKLWPALLQSNTPLLASFVQLFKIYRADGSFVVIPLAFRIVSSPFICILSVGPLDFRDICIFLAGKTYSNFNFSILSEILKSR